MKYLSIILLFVSSTLTFAKDDLLHTQELSIKSGRYADVIDLTAANLKDVFKDFKLVMGPGFSVVKPLMISGTQAMPNFRATLKKCVTIICETVDVDADLVISEAQGSCAENYYLKADLDKSGELLTNVYEYFFSVICVNPSPEGATATLKTYAARARGYSGGPIASTIKDFLRLQIAPLMSSLQRQLDENIRVIEGN